MTAMLMPLLRALNVAKPALASKPYLPALTHFRIENGVVLACNGVMAIEVISDQHTGIDACIPGDLLLKALGSVKDGAMQLSVIDNVLQIKAGRSKVKMPVLPLEDFPFELPEQASGPIPLSADLLKGLLQCVTSAGVDANHPEMIGVTLANEKGKVVVYATNNITLSRYISTQDAVKLPGGMPVFLPSEFCNRLCGIAKGLEATPQLMFADGAVLADIAEVSLYSKLPADLALVNYLRVIGDHSAHEPTPIPNEFETALQRALILLDKEPLKTTRMEIRDGTLLLSTKCSAGSVEDEMPCKHENRKPFDIDPALVLQGSKMCTHLGVSRRAMVMTGERFLHLITLF